MRKYLKLLMRFSRKGYQDQFANSNMEAVGGRDDVYSSHFQLFIVLVLKTTQELMELLILSPSSPNQDLITVSALPKMES